MGDSTADPSHACEEFDSTFSDDDEFFIGPASANDQELSHEEENKAVNKEDFVQVYVYLIFCQSN